MTIIDLILCNIAHVCLFCPWTSILLVPAPLSALLIGVCFMANSMFSALKEVEQRKTSIAARSKQLGDRRACIKQPFTAPEREQCNAFEELSIHSVLELFQFSALYLEDFDDKLIQPVQERNNQLTLSNMPPVQTAPMRRLRILPDCFFSGQEFCPTASASCVRSSIVPFMIRPPPILKAPRYTQVIPTSSYDPGDAVAEWLGGLETIYPEVYNHIRKLEKYVCKTVYKLICDNPDDPKLQQMHDLIYNVQEFNECIHKDNLDGLKSMLVPFSVLLTAKYSCEMIDIARVDDFVAPVIVDVADDVNYNDDSNMPPVEAAPMRRLRILPDCFFSGQEFCPTASASCVRSSIVPFMIRPPPILKVPRYTQVIPTSSYDPGDAVAEWLGGLETIYPEICSLIKKLEKKYMCKKVHKLIRDNPDDPQLKKVRAMRSHVQNFNECIQNDNLDGLKSMLVPFSVLLARKSSCEVIDIARVNEFVALSVGIVLVVVDKDEDRDEDDKNDSSFGILDRASVFSDGGGDNDVNEESKDNSMDWELTEDIVPCAEEVPVTGTVTVGIFEVETQDEVDAAIEIEVEAATEVEIVEEVIEIEVEVVPELDVSDVASQQQQQFTFSQLQPVPTPRRCSRRLRGLPPTSSCIGLECKTVQPPPRRSQRLSCLPRVNYRGM